MNSQPAVDKLCVTCLAVLPYMETCVSEYSRALPRGKEGERSSEGQGGKDEEEEEGIEAGEGESKGKKREEGVVTEGAKERSAAK